MLASLPHHDGSELYVAELPAELGDETTVLLRVPRATAVNDVAVRYVRDGEPNVATAEVDRETETDVWWRASFPVWNPATPYRWLLSGGDLGYAWLNAAGLQRFDVPDADDFVATPDPGGPGWHLQSVVYEVFPDRFASAGLDVEAPEWAVARGWDELPTGRGPLTPVEWFGGDLVGLEQRLDHIADLGANVVYLTPIFPAGSTHRYDAASFSEVDPLLGGDEALVALVRSAHERGMRVLGDLTTNHVGDRHPWFLAARNGSEAPEREFFTFDDRLEHGYESWYGVPSLPKLDYRSQELRRRIYADDSSVVARWLEPPYSLDGWRVDVANMTGRLHDVDLTAEVARRRARAARAARADAVVVAEHAHDSRADLRPVRGTGRWRTPVSRVRSGHGCAATIRGVTSQRISSACRSACRACPARRSSRRCGASAPASPGRVSLHSWAILDSHDTARFRTVAGSRERQLVGVGLQMTSPGVPMVFAGAEIGLEGEWGEDARRTMPWSHPETWDTELRDRYRELVALRRSSTALGRGGIRYLHVTDDAIAYVRETKGETVLCLAARAPHDPLRVELGALGGRELETLHGGGESIAGGEAVLPGDGPAFHAWRVA